MSTQADSSRDTSAFTDAVAPAPNNLVQSDEKALPTPSEHLPRDITGWKWYLAVVAILLSIFLYALDVTVVAAVQPIIVTEFNALDKLPWMSVAFLLAATATNLLWGRLYTQYNSKWLYIFNVALFEAGSALCGAAPNMNALIAGRAICGISGAGLYVGVMTLISITTTIAERPVYVSMTGITWGLGIVLGPLVGGGFGDSSIGWRWAFYINLVIGAVCAPAWLLLLPSKDPRSGVPYRQRLAEMDYFGCSLMMGGLVCLMLAISSGGVSWAWRSASSIGLFAAAGVIFAMLSIQQIFTIFTTKERRIVPLQFFRSRTVLILFSTTAASGAAAFVPIYFIPLFFQFTRNDGALQAGVRLLPLIVVMVVMILANGALMAKFGYYMPWYLVGSLLAVAGSALMYTVDNTTSDSRIYGYTVLIGLGVGMFLQASFSVTQAVVAPADIPPAVGFMTLAQYVGITISLSVANAVFLNESQTSISDILPDVSDADIQASIEGAGGSFLNGLSQEDQARVVGAIATAIGRAYVLVITACSLVAVLSLFMKGEKLFGAAAVAVA
ncbi:putative MFS drug efflux transporter [Sarocladium strictum]